MGFGLFIRPFPDCEDFESVRNCCGNAERRLVWQLPEYLGVAAGRFPLLHQMVCANLPNGEHHYDPQAVLAEVKLLRSAFADTPWPLPAFERDMRRAERLTHWCREKGIHRHADLFGDGADASDEAAWHDLIHFSPRLTPLAQYVLCLSQVTALDRDHFGPLKFDPGPQCALVASTGMLHLVAGEEDELEGAADWTTFPHISAREFRWKGDTLLADDRVCSELPPSFACPLITLGRVTAREVPLDRVFAFQLRNLQHACELAITSGCVLYPSQ